MDVLKKPGLNPFFFWFFSNPASEARKKLYMQIIFFITKFYNFVNQNDHMNTYNLHRGNRNSHCKKSQKKKKKEFNIENFSVFEYHPKFDEALHLQTFLQDLGLMFLLLLVSQDRD